MAFIAEDRVRETTTTTGTGAVALAGAVAGFRAFSSVMANADTCQYVIWSSSQWEVGIGTFNTGGTLTRTTILSSSNAGSAVNLSAGTKEVAITLGARPYLGHPVVVPAGSNSACAVTTHGDPNSGITFPATDTMAFVTGGVEAARIDSAARLLIGITSANTAGAVIQTKDGVTFPSTAVLSTDPNTLDAYEEGSWTPAVVGGTTAGTYSELGQSNGRYVRIGRQVFVSAYILISTSGNSAGSGDLRVSGLPFSISGSFEQRYCGAGYIDSAATSHIATMVRADFTPSTSLTFVHKTASATSWTATPVTFVSTTAGTTIRLFATYII